MICLVQSGEFQGDLSSSGSAGSGLGCWCHPVVVVLELPTLPAILALDLYK